jgi:hypothetical protein
VSVRLVKLYRHVDRPWSRSAVASRQDLLMSAVLTAIQQQRALDQHGRAGARDVPRDTVSGSGRLKRLLAGQQVR